MPARRATRRTMRAAPWRSRRWPASAVKIGPADRSPMARSTARAVRGASGIVTVFPPLRTMVSVRCPRSTPRASISAPIASDTRSPLSASDEKRANLVAVQANDVGLVVDPVSADMDCRGMSDYAFLFGVAVEAGDGAQPPGDRRRCTTSSLELTSEGLDVATANLKQPEVAQLAEGDELAEIKRVGVASEAPVASEEPLKRDMFRIDQARVVDDYSGRGGGGHGIPPESMGPRTRGHQAPVDEDHRRRPAPQPSASPGAAICTHPPAGPGRAPGTQTAESAWAPSRRGQAPSKDRSSCSAAPAPSCVARWRKHPSASRRGSATGCGQRSSTLA